MSSSEYLLRTSREHALYVLDHRAIPALTDGLKSSQRIVLWLLRNRSEKIKTIALAGQMIASELYLHGDTSASGAISMLAGPYCNNRPLVRGIGAFGTRANPTSFAAPRYTSVKRSKLAQDVLYADLDIVPLVDNHDGSNQMPGTFLPLIPLVLLNGIRGIATGWSTNILPHRYEDLVGAVGDVLSRKPVRDLMPHYENRDVTVVREHGEPNKYIISGKAAKKNTTTVTVTELPPDLNLETFREKLGALEEDGKISSFTDRSTKAINIEVKMKRADLAKLTDAGLIDFLKLRTLTTENITVQGIGGGKVITYDGTDKLIKDWVEWRLGLYLDRFKKLLADEKATNLYWRYVIACFDGRPETGDQSVPEFSRKLTVDELRYHVSLLGKVNKLPKAPPALIERIINIPIYRWTLEGREKAEAELTSSKHRLIKYKEMVDSDRLRKALFKREVSALK
jgi:DNA gyrase/topoisomerase IV subunit A